MGHPRPFPSVLRACLLSLACTALLLLSLTPHPVLGASFPLTVHLVAHSHEDVGYEKTMDQYYWGSNQTIRKAGVRYRMDSIVPALEAHPSRRFMQVESAFFHPWWRQQPESIRARVRRLVSSGQLELVSGGWCMHDEAVTTAVDIVDQMTLGHKWLVDTFGAEAGIPTTGWQIDPFGHSSTSAALMAQMGFDAMYVGRIDWQDKLYRMASKTMELLWDSSPSLGSEASTLWTANFVAHYGAPAGFCMDDGCDGGGADPIIDDPEMEEYNADKRAKEFYDLMMLNAEFYEGSDVLITIGGDFLFNNAPRSFANLDKLIHYVNELAAGKIVLKYSTPGEYTAAKLKSGKLKYKVKTDDFFPYADYFNAYWTGYYTSRPLLKRMVRTSSSTLQAARQLEFLGGLSEGAHAGPTRTLSEAVAVAQHHDAATGTEMQHVAYDYAQRMSRGLAKAEWAMAQVLGEMVSRRSGAVPPNLSQCRLAANESLCTITQQATQPGVNPMPPVLVLLYNPLSHARSGELVAVPVERPDLIVLDSQLRVVASQIVDHEVPHALHGHYTSRRNVLRRNAATERRNAQAQRRRDRAAMDGGRDEASVKRPKAEVLEAVPSRYTLYFPAELAPLGVESYFIQASGRVESMATQAHDAGAATAKKTKNPSRIRAASPKEDPSGSLSAPLLTLSNSVVTLSFSPDTGLLVGHTDHTSGGGNVSFALRQDWLFYESFVDPTGKTQNAGAYISRFGNDNVPFPISSSNNGSSVPTAKLSFGAQGPLVWEAHQEFAPWCVQTVRLRRDSPEVEFEWTVGPVPLTDADGVDRGKEVVTRFTLDSRGSPAPFDRAQSIDNGGVWFTDSNAREMIRRRRDHRDTWDVSHEEPVASNYAPITNLAFMHDGETQGVPRAQLSILSDRAQGCASITNRSMELMVHRRLVADDNKGVHEPLNETQSITHYPNPRRIGVGISVRGSHRLILSTRDNDWAPSFASSYRPAAQRLYLPAQASFAVLDSDVPTYLKTHSPSLQLGSELPPALELLTLAGWDDDTALVRLAHSYALGEDVALSGPVRFDLATLFPHLRVGRVEELSLTANQLARDLAKKPRFNLQRAAGSPPLNDAKQGPILEEGSTEVTITAMQIRTFQVWFKP